MESKEVMVQIVNIGMGGTQSKGGYYIGSTGGSPEGKFGEGGYGTCSAPGGGRSVDGMVVVLVEMVLEEVVRDM